MRAWRGVAATLLTLTALAAPALADTPRSVDAAHSHARFSVTHVYVAEVSGTVPILDASVLLADGSALPLRANATLDARHVDTGNGDRDDDLQGPDWFDVRRYPAWTFASTSVVAGPNGTFTLNGMLTVHGVSQPVALAGTIVRGLPNPVYHVVGKVDRHAFGMKITPMDPLIGNEAQLVLDIALR